MEKPSRSFTGRTRDRRTNPIVKINDVIARTCITIGGIGTIIAIATVCFYLIYVAVPLFHQAKPLETRAHALPWAKAEQNLIRLEIDEYRVLGYAMFADGSVQAFRADTGTKVGEPQRPFVDDKLTAWSFSSDAADVAFGFADGRARLGTMAIRTSFVPDDQVPDDLWDLPVGAVAYYQDSVVTKTPANQLRAHKLEITLKPPFQLSAHPIRLLGHTIRNTGPVILAMSEDDVLTVNSISETRNFLTGAVTPRVTKINLPYEPAANAGRPSHFLISGLGDTAYLAWRDGQLHRFDMRNLQAPVIAEKVNLIDRPNGRLEILQFMIGRTTLLVGDETGRIDAWFAVKPSNATTSDGQYLRRTHELGTYGSPVTAIATSARSRMMAAGFADGSVRLFHVTTNQILTQWPSEGTGPIRAMAMGAKDDVVLVASEKGLWEHRFDRKYPTINLHSITRPVWYEGYEQPMHMWQSSSGTDDFEPKYGLWPLVFGTLKATFYSMLFGLPIALSAAVFTSEFLHPRVKAKIKPTIELMASLPSVVLGFLAALVIAPVIEKVVPATISVFFIMPMCFLVGAYLWQLLPQTSAIRLRPWRFPLLVASVPVSILISLRIGPVIEKVLFAGDVRLWLDGQIGSGVAGWMIIFMPMSALLTAVLVSKFVNPEIRARSSAWTRKQSGLIDLAKFALGGLIALVIAILVGVTLTTLGFDPRGSELHHTMGTYVQRNAMIVGFIMGFAVIPIIYTIAEDALSAVPEHLRSASLGAGATPWQTAVRIVIPTAMSGLFSAVMIGLGRAVGETMIVLMAAGNTPVMQMNIFNGFRTLSANIAVELPEAPIGGTHYRTLFLAALTLFIMTFIVNTIAEVIRLRFRKRAFQL